MKIGFKYLGLILGVFALLVNAFFANFPALADKMYYRGVFQVIRVVYDHTLGLLPIPMVYVLFLVLVWFIARLLGRMWDVLKGSSTLRTKIIDSVSSILNATGWVLFLFYLLWGWNYQKTSFEKRMGFEPIQGDTTMLISETSMVMESLTVLRRKITADSNHITDGHLPSSLENDLRELQEDLLTSLGEPTLGRVRIRKLRPAGILLRISTSGVYIPFVCEGHVDVGLHSLQYPFTMAHEMAHGYGFTDEGVCNFIGFVTCLKSEDEMVKYAGLLGYWRYLLSTLRTYAPHSYRQIRSEMPNPIRRDLNDIADQMDKYPDILPQVRNAVYDSYLKSHGVKGGIANYNDIVKLVAQWRQKNEDTEKIERIY